jgi:hypothetical protein
LLNARDPVGFRTPTVERHTERVKIDSGRTWPCPLSTTQHEVCSQMSDKFVGLEWALGSRY